MRRLYDALQAPRTARVGRLARGAGAGGLARRGDGGDRVRGRVRVRDHAGLGGVRGVPARGRHRRGGAQALRAAACWPRSRPRCCRRRCAARTGSSCGRGSTTSRPRWRTWSPRPTPTSRGCGCTPACRCGRASGRTRATTRACSPAGATSKRRRTGSRESTQRAQREVSALQVAFLEAARRREAAEAERTRELLARTLARQLAAQAELVRDTSVESVRTSVLLAAESVEQWPSVEGDRALRRGLALLSRRPLHRVEHPRGLVALARDGSLARGSRTNASSSSSNPPVGAVIARRRTAAEVRALATRPRRRHGASHLRVARRREPRADRAPARPSRSWSRSRDAMSLLWPAA